MKHHIVYDTYNFSRNKNRGWIIEVMRGTYRKMTGKERVVVNPEQYKAILKDPTVHMTKIISFIEFEEKPTGQLQKFLGGK